MPIMAQTTKTVSTSAEKSNVNPFANTIAKSAVIPDTLFMMTPPYICMLKSQVQHRLIIQVRIISENQKQDCTASIPPRMSERP